MKQLSLKAGLFYPSTHNGEMTKNLEKTNILEFSLMIRSDLNIA